MLPATFFWVLLLSLATRGAGLQVGRLPRRLMTRSMSDVEGDVNVAGAEAVDAEIEALAIPVVPRALTPISELQVLKKTDRPTSHDGSYIMCSSCKTAYVVGDHELGRRGMRVRCGVCDKEWYQSGERLLKTDGQNRLFNMTEEKVADVRKAISDRNWPKWPLTDRIGIFVGNLPYDYSEKEIGELFGEYGVTAISLVKDPAGVSKGFAFIELSNEQDVDLMIKEMHLFHVSPCSPASLPVPPSVED